jgi:hypothetical protein
MSASLIPSATPREGPLVERKSLIGFREACEQLWGRAGYERICEALPADVRERTAGLRPLVKWIPVDDLIAWHRAVWNGPAAHDEKVMIQHTHATVDRGFGRVKKFFLNMATPRTLAPRVAALWRDEYSTGRLEATFVDDQAVQLKLSGHPFVDDPLMRFVISEVFRYVLSMTRVKRVSGSHAVLASSLVVFLGWE